MIYIVEEAIDKMGGVERIVSTLANSFVDRGKKVRIISFYKTKEKPFFEYNSSIAIDYLVNDNREYKLKNKLNFINIVNKWKRIVKNISDEDTIIFGRVSVAVKIIPYIKNKPTIIVRDAINIYDHSFIIKYLMKKQFPKKVSYFIVSSDESLNLYRDFFGNTTLKINKIYNPLSINTNKISDYNFDNFTILATGRFDYQKGFENLIYAFKKINTKYPNWKLKIVGNGPLKSIYTKIIKENNIRNISLVESKKDIEEELNNASIYIMTSRYEGYANALVEAVAFGIPSISFDWLTGVDEIIKNNKNGLIVPLKNRLDYKNGIDNIENVNNLVDSIEKLINDKELCIEMNKYRDNILKSRNKDSIIDKWEMMLRG